MSGRILVVEHADDCGVGLIGTWLREAGCELDVRRPHAGQPLPEDLRGLEGLLVLGGPMGANDDDRHGWLGPVKALARTAVADGLPTLGVCLGHQLIAVALGGAVAVNPRGQQVGLLEVGWTGQAREDELFAALATPRRGVHWNHDVVTDLPPGASQLAVAPGGEPQVVRYGPRAWGVQLHPEVDGAAVRPWAVTDRAEHDALGIDQGALLGEIDAATAELDLAWRPLAQGLARLAAERRV